MTKEIIYVNGDSFTQGCDLEDHLYPDFERYYSLGELRSLTLDQLMERQRADLIKKETFVKTNLEKSFEYTQSRYVFRWSHVLENILNKPVFNLSSHGGSSMYAIAYRTMADVVCLKNQGYNITDIIIQITGSGRISIFKNNNIYEEPPIQTSALLKNIKYNIISKNFISAKNTQYQTLFEHAMLHETNSFNEYRLLHDLFMLKHALESLTKARVIFVDSVFYKKTIGNSKNFTFTDCDLTEDNHIVKFKQQLDQDIKLSMLECVEENEPDTMTAGMHFTAKIHRRFAELVAETYFK
jgi:hypothetical protein